jgi:hypothetical protein
LAADFPPAANASSSEKKKKTVAELRDFAVASGVFQRAVQHITRAEAERRQGGAVYPKKCDRNR